MHPEHRAHEQVAAEIVRAKQAPAVEGWPSELRVEVDLVVDVRAEQRTDERDDDNAEQNAATVFDRATHRRRILGSMTLYSRSTSRFSMTTSIA